jgi:hypothetical protein
LPRKKCQRSGVLVQQPAQKFRIRSIHSRKVAANDFRLIRRSPQPSIPQYFVRNRGTGAVFRATTPTPGPITGCGRKDRHSIMEVYRISAHFPGD